MKRMQTCFSRKDLPACREELPDAKSLIIPFIPSFLSSLDHEGNLNTFAKQQCHAYQRIERNIVFLLRTWQLYLAIYFKITDKDMDVKDMRKYAMYRQKSAVFKQVSSMM